MHARAHAFHNTQCPEVDARQSNDGNFLKLDNDIMLDVNLCPLVVMHVGQDGLEHHVPESLVFVGVVCAQVQNFPPAHVHGYMFFCKETSHLTIGLGEPYMFDWE